MTKTKALALLRKILGKRLAYQENPKGLTQDERDALHVENAVLSKAVTDAGEARFAMRAKVLAEHVEYQCLKAEHEARIAARNALHKRLYGSRRVVVGVADGMFFHVRADGDNWQEVVDKVAELTRRQKGVTA